MQEEIKEIINDRVGVPTVETVETLPSEKVVNILPSIEVDDIVPAKVEDVTPESL